MPGSVLRVRVSAWRYVKKSYWAIREKFIWLPLKAGGRSSMSFFLLINNRSFFNDFNKKTMTILLVDDDEDDRKLFFEAAGEVDKEIKCIGAAGGQEALEYLSDAANPVPDFIFLDLRMPGLSGQQTLEEIKKDARLTSVPV